MEDVNDGHGSTVEPLAKARRAESIDVVPRGNAALLQMAEYTGDLIGLCDAGGRLVYLNPAGRRLIGIEDADIFPMRLTDYVVPDQRHLVDEVVVPTARRDGVWRGDMQLANLRTGAIIDVQRSTFATRDERGAVTGFVSVMRDVTQAKAEEHRLRRQVETFEALIANNPFGVYLVDADFTLRVVSRGAQTVFANVRPLIGRDFADILRAVWPEPFASEAIGHFRRTLDTGIAYQAGPTSEQRADVEAREAYDWRIERVSLPDGRYGVVCYFYDLTEREDWTHVLAEREAELRDLTTDLERRVRARTAALNLANERLATEIERREAVQAAQLQSQKLEALGQLTSGVAHDFNNILGAVIGGFTIIQNRNDDPRIQQIATMGQRAAERGAALVRQLLAFARQEDVVAQHIDLAGAIGEISDLIKHGMRGTVALTLECDTGLWPVHADPTQLQSALLNLANNASDAMNGVGHLRIAVSNCAAAAADHPLELSGQDAIRIVVADDGPGMSSDTLQRITEPFFTTKERGKGTGLGLAMVQRFVEQSGGALRIESRLGQGTTFSIYLPRAVDRGVSAASLASEDTSGDVAGRAFETVLLVDDDDELCAMIAEGLADEGFDVVVARDARAALDVLRTRGVDALVTDVAMPDMTGIDLVARVRASGPDIPCVFMTGITNDAALTGETVVQKPFSPAVLHYALRRILIARDRRASDAEQLDRLALRLKSDCTRSLLDHWRAVRGALTVPLFDAFAITACSEPHRIVVARIDLGKVPIDFTFTLVGNTLRDAVPDGIDLADMPVSGNDALAAREAAYRRCALTGKPSYEHARIDLGDGYRETFERLLLPFSSDGVAVDHIVGAVVIEREAVEE